MALTMEASKTVPSETASVADYFPAVLQTCTDVGHLVFTLFFVVTLTLELDMSQRDDVPTYQVW